jgi:lipoprotein-releasing system permease protein
MNGLTATVAQLYNALEPDIKITALKDKGFVYSPQMQKMISGLPGIVFTSQTLSDKALIKNGNQQVLVTVKGVDANFTRMTKFDSVLVEGFNGVGDTTVNYVVTGWGVADQLGIGNEQISRDVQLYSPKRGKSTSINPGDDMNQIYGSVSGQFTLNNELDYEAVFVSLSTARELFDAPERISALEISCENGKSDQIQKQLKEIFGPDFEVKNRYQLNDVLFKSLETEKLATFIILAFILIIATFNLIGALTMLIIEKRRDIKTLYSLGANLSTIRSIFMREGLLISVIGAVLGLLLGLVVCLVQIKFHVVQFGSDFIVPYYPVELQAEDFVKLFALILLIAFIAALYPVRVFTKTDLLHSKN